MAVISVLTSSGKRGFVRQKFLDSTIPARAFFMAEQVLLETRFSTTSSTRTFLFDTQGARPGRRRFGAAYEHNPFPSTNFRGNVFHIR